MKDEKLEYDVQKRARASTAATARVAVSLYIIWLGYKIIRGALDGSNPMPPILAWTAGIFFIAAAIAFCYYTWRRWRADVEAARLPETEESDLPDA